MAFLGEHQFYGVDGEGGTNEGMTRETGRTKQFPKAKGRVSIRRKQVNIAEQLRTKMNCWIRQIQEQ